MQTRIVSIAGIGAMRRYDAGGRLAALAGIPTLVVSAEYDRLSLRRRAWSATCRSSTWLPPGRLDG